MQCRRCTRLPDEIGIREQEDKEFDRKDHKAERRHVTFYLSR